MPPRDKDEGLLLRKDTRGQKVAQWINRDDPNSTPKSHMLEQKVDSSELSSDLRMGTEACMSTYVRQLNVM